MKNPRNGSRSNLSTDRNCRPGRVRIIGGRWRGTRLDVADAAGLRPTSDRVRETLFNWLAPALSGARVLDLFAGSGALGLEAVSRGAQSAVLVERNPALATALRATAARLAGGGVVSVAQADASSWLQTAPESCFDIAFVDPPFAADLWADIVPKLLSKLAADAWLYIESPPDAAIALPHDWALHREGSTSEVRYALYRRNPHAASPPAAADTLGVDPAGQRARLFEPANQ